MIDVLFLLSWWALWLFLPTCSPHYKACCYGIALLLLTATGSLSTYYYYRNAYPLGIIHKDGILRVGPHETYGTCGIAKEHDKIVVCDVHDAWKQVQKVGSDVRGWIPQDYITTDVP